MNDAINSPELRLIGPEGENVGVVSPRRAMELAERAGLDLVEISPNAAPPVCKIMDFGKYKYERLLKCSPDFAQEVMENVLRDIEDADCYIDDVGCFSNSWDKHLELLDEVLS